MMLADWVMIGLVYTILSSYYFNIRASVFRKHILSSNRYKLFKVRDDLIYLVAANQLKEEDFLFRYFYESTNFFVNRTEEFNLKNLINAIKQCDKERNILAKNTIEKIRNELENKNKEVEEVINSFYTALEEIFIENNVLLRIVIKNEIIKKIARFIYKIIDHTHTTLFEKQVWDEYKKINAAQVSLAS